MRWPPRVQTGGDKISKAIREEVIRGQGLANDAKSPAHPVIMNDAQKRHLERVRGDLGAGLNGALV